MKERGELTAQGLREVANTFKALGDPVRLRVLELLCDGAELSVGDIAKRLECSQPNASRHLGKLFDRGIVARRRTGNTVLYFIEDLSILELCEAVCHRLEKDAARKVGLRAPAAS